jgi:rpsU-divergently transcribed protein
MFAKFDIHIFFTSKKTPTSLKHIALLVDDIWHATSDHSSYMDWYTKSALLGIVYMTTKLYMFISFTIGCET